MSLIIIVLALAATAIITACLSMTTGGSTVQRRALMHEQAVFLADAGFEHALMMLTTDPWWRDGFTDKPLGAGTYTVTLVDDGDDTVITSTGTVGTITAQVGIRVGWQ